MKNKSEAGFQESVIGLAVSCGWRVHHQRPGRTRDKWASQIIGHPGMPDLLMARGTILIMAELKAGKNKCTKAQLDWIDALGKTGIIVRVWRPEDWELIYEELR